MSCGTVTMWQPLCSAWKMLSTSRTLAQSNSALGWSARIARLARITGIGSTPVSAMRPAKTETTEGTAGLSAAATVRDLLERENGGDVELHALCGQFLNEGERGLAA